jgi:flavin reductase (DIM6/NTAB) family NADH-FMN oxidoreductase RutF
MLLFFNKGVNKMKRKKINVHDLILKPTNIWENEWFLLSAGDYKTGDHNAMTVAWGSLGTMWSKPFAQVVVRPSRHSYEFMNKYDTFTLSHFPAKYKKALSYLGTVSGSDEPEKMQKSGLTPCAVPGVDAPGYEEADLVIACKKIYWQDMDAEHFLKEGILDKYPEGNNFHRIYFGEIVSCESAL